MSSRLASAQLPPALSAATWAQRQRLGAIVVPAGTDAAAAARVRRAVGEAFVAGFRRVMLACAALALLAALCAWALIDGKRRSPKEHIPIQADVESAARQSTTTGFVDSAIGSA